MQRYFVDHMSTKKTSRPTYLLPLSTPTRYPVPSIQTPRTLIHSLNRPPQKECHLTTSKNTFNPIYRKRRRSQLGNQLAPPPINKHTSTQFKSFCRTKKSKREKNFIVRSYTPMCFPRAVPFYACMHAQHVCTRSMHTYTIDSSRPFDEGRHR